MENARSSDAGPVGRPSPALLLSIVVLISALLQSLQVPVIANGASKGDDSPKKRAAPANVVIVYITSWCPACKMTTDYLREKKIPFVAKDIEKNEAYMKELLEKVGAYRGVPVLDINGRIFLGFNPYVLDELTK